MVNNFVGLTVSIFIILTVVKLKAKPLNDEIDLNNKKCDELTWIRRDDETWDVIKKYDNITSTEGIQVWWPSLERCVDLATEKLCEDRGSTVLNSRHEGSCDCHEPYTAVENNPGCHQYYEQGPCAEGEVITYDKSQKKGVCSKDSCAKQNDNVSYYDNRFIEIYGNGTCYALSGDEACGLHEEAELEIRKILHCRSMVEAFALFPSVCTPSKDIFTCRVSMTGNDERDKYISQLKMDLE